MRRDQTLRTARSAHSEQRWQPFLSRTIGDHLRRIREAAGLTQVELAKRLRRSQAFICGTERGTTKVGERYVKAVLKACGAPEDA